MASVGNLHRQITGVTVISWIGGFLLVGGMARTPVTAQPPPELLEFGEELPKTPLPPSQPSPVWLPPALPVPTPSNSITLPPSQTPVAPTANRYQVEVFGDTPQVLSQVRQIAPQASVRSGAGVIQVGVFDEAAQAQTLARQLQQQGLATRVIPLISQRRTRANNPPPPINSQNPANTTAYFVVIPANRSKLPDIAAEVIELGIEPELVEQREAPRGTHVAIGPFGTWAEADSWNSYLRSEGMDARVYFRR